MSLVPESPMAAVTDAAVSVTFLPNGRTAHVERGATLLRAARRAGVSIDAPCAERGRCGKCRVHITEGEVSALAPEEAALLTAADIAAGIRLSCMARAAGNVVVTIPDSSRNLALRKATAELPRPINADPFIRKICAQVAIPSLSGQDLRDDFTRLREAIPALVDAELAALRDLPSALAAGGQSVTAVLAGNRLIAVEPGDTTTAHYGLALDIGTTTLVGYLLDLRDGREVAAVAHPNPQAAFGGDVISRIEFAQGNVEHTETLRKSVTEAVNTILREVTTKAGVAAEAVYEIVAVGNTCMMHLFLGIDPRALGLAPYTPVFTAPQTVPAAALGLRIIHPRGLVRTLPNIAGFVGADCVGVLAAADFEQRPGLYVSVDIGTNAEVMVSRDGKITACSTAAGPAFEGAKISQGMRAQPGAIDGVVIGGDIYIHTIDEQPPLGICGSGVIDAIGELRRVGLLESSGRFVNVEELTDLPEALRARLTDDGIVLVWAAESGAGRDIVLTRQDVREIQLVKGAIYAGIATMLEKIGHAPEELDGLLIAGAFGTYINKTQALAIGLIPNIPLEKLTFLGNAAGVGAKMALISRQEYAAICQAARQVGYIELAGDPAFSEHFMSAMTLAPGCEDE